MLHLFKNRQKNSGQEQYLDFVSRIALPAFKQGKIGYVNFLQRVFTIKDAKNYHIEVAEAFTELLTHTSVKGHLSFQRVFSPNVYGGTGTVSG